MARIIPPGIIEAANIIAPSDAPPWLVTLLTDWLPTLAIDRGVHAIQPTKADMREQMLAVRNAARVLYEGLRNVAVKEFLEVEGAIRIENLGGLEETLRVIGERARLAASSSQISTSDGKGKKGTGKALPNTAYSPQTFCAVLISEVWNFLRGEYPAARNIQAAKAADAYWRATGGIAAHQWGTGSAGRWRYHFEQAKSPATEKERKEIRRHCAQHSDWNQRLIEPGK
jgi:hypothetical protein